MNSLLTGDQRIATLAVRPGSEWLEALIATGKRYAVPRLTGGADLWDGTVLVKSLSLAMQRAERLESIVRGLTPAQRDALWTDTSAAGAAMRAAAARLGIR